MTSYVLRRLLHMIPTMLGVVLVTFVLFNLVGGSPGRMILGDKASARDLEAFDEQRGFNRPLFWGYHAPTRLYSATDLLRSAGPWASVSEASWAAGEGLKFVGPAQVSIPLAFASPPEHRYRWSMKYELEGKVSVEEGNQPLALAEGADGAVEWVGGHVDTRGPVFKMEDGSVLRIRELACRRVHDVPWESQWSHYLGQLMRFDFGRSHAANRSVSDLLWQGIRPTLMLATPILVGECIISLVLALGCAYYRNRLFDRMTLFFCVILMSVNYLVWIVAGQYWLAYRLDLFPVWGFESWVHLLLPVAIGILHGLGPNVRFYRTVMLEEMHRDYVRTARAKGVGAGGILFHHVLKNAMIPVITNVVLSLPFLYTGSLLLESFFGIPGLGYLSVNAINSSDVDVVRAVVLIGSFLYLVTNLLADVAYALVDPRVKLS